MVIRDANPEDSAAIAEITAEGLGYDCTLEVVARNIAALDRTHARLFVAEIDGSVVGFVEPQVYEAVYFATLVNILGLAVRESHRGTGIGKALMEAAENWAKEIGAKGVRLNSGATRTNAHGFYRHIGYTTEKKQIRFMKEF
jgi:GNAT superfamily N-acetyltransferase